MSEPRSPAADWLPEPRAGRASRRDTFAGLTVVAGVLLIASLVVAQLPARHAPTHTDGVALPAAIEMFDRVDAQTAWAVDRNDLYVTRDGGASWQKGTLPGRGLAAVAAPSPIAGPSIDPSPCAGLDCGGREASGVPDRLYPDFVDADHGWLVSWTLSNSADYAKSDFNLSVARTSDGGRTWTSSALPGAYKGFAHPWFVDGSRGFIVVNSIEALMGETAGPAKDGTVVLATTDGGVTWTRRSSLDGVAIVAFVSDSEAWATSTPTRDAGSTLVLLHSRDGARTWQPAPIAIDAGCTVTLSPAAITPVRAGDALELRLPCDAPRDPQVADSGSRIVVARSVDGGSSWSVAQTRATPGPPQYPAASVALLMHTRLQQPIVSTFQANGASSYWASFDGGLSWRSCSMGGLRGRVVLAEWARPDDVWIAVQEDGGSVGLSLHLYASTRAGRSWTAMAGPPSSIAAAATSAAPSVLPTIAPVETAPLDQEIGAFGAVDAKTAWAVEGSTFLITHDGGATWEAAPGPILDVEVVRVDVFDADHFASLVLPNPSLQASFVTFDIFWMAGGTAGSTTLSGAAPENLVSVDGYVHYIDHDNAFVHVEATGSDTTACLRWDTHDGGLSWSGFVTSDCTGRVQWVTPMVGYANDGGSSPFDGFTVTTDGGASWNSAPIPNPSGTGSLKGTVSAVSVSPDGSLRAILPLFEASAGTVLEVAASSDGGRSWAVEQEARISDDSILSVGVAGPDHWFAYPATPGRVFETGDRGASWAPRPLYGLDGTPLSVEFTPDTAGWILARATDGSGLHALFTSADGGYRWTRVLPPAAGTVVTRGPGKR